MDKRYSGGVFAGKWATLLADDTNPIIAGLDLLELDDGFASLLALVNAHVAAKTAVAPAPPQSPVSSTVRFGTPMDLPPTERTAGPRPSVALRTPAPRA